MCGLDTDCSCCFCLVCRHVGCRTFIRWKFNLRLMVQCLLVKSSHQGNDGWELTIRVLTCLLKVHFVCALLPAWINCSVCFNSWERRRVNCDGGGVSFDAHMWLCCFAWNNCPKRHLTSQILPADLTLLFNSPSLYPDRSPFCKRNGTAYWLRTMS